MIITIIGAGYVGLVNSACLAEFGHRVVCVDLDAEKIDQLNQGKIPIYEPGLVSLMQGNLKRERVVFTTDLEPWTAKSDVIFIAVGTPSCRRGSGYADMGYVFDAARSFAPFLDGYTVIVNKSTVPVGTARDVSAIIAETNPSVDFDVASNPEFLREGSALYDFMHPDRIVLGTDSKRAEKLLRRVYEPLYLNNTPFIMTTPESAELIKYASNAFLATKISFINEMAILCEAVGADIQDVAKGMGLDGRIGPKFLHAGAGFGGSCFPKDTLALMKTAEKNGVPTRIVQAAVEVNDMQKKRMINKICDAFSGNGVGKTVAVLGLTFKPETDDMREAPSLTIIPGLLEHGFHIKAHDPVGMKEAESYLSAVEFVQDPYAACMDADGVCILTEWNPYRALDLHQIKRQLKRPLFIDLRNVYDIEIMREIGFEYISVGRPAIREKSADN